MDETSHVHDALGRLRAVFQVTADAELMDTDLAEITGLDEEECRALLKVLLESGAIEQRRRRVFSCRSPN